MKEIIGKTPLIEIDYLSQRCGATILAKAEFLNPAGSVKDRIAHRMISEAIREGKITKDTLVIEATSGNTGIALAAVCAARGLRLSIVMPESMSIERRLVMTHLGAEVVLTPADKGMAGAVERAEELASSMKNTFLTRQFENPENPNAHYFGTGPEILEDVGSERIDIFVAGVGTGGTLSGTARALKESFPDMKSVAVEPASSAVIGGDLPGAHAIEGIGAGFIPKVLDISILDETISVTDDEAFRYAREAARSAGLLVGVSSGANLAAAEKLASRPENRGASIVTILPDGAERYLSGKLLDAK